MGGNPRAVERMVMSVESPTSLTVDQVYNTAYSSVGYTASDPLDIEAGAMATAFLRLIEYQLTILNRDREEMSMVGGAYKQALLKAKEADARVTTPRSVGTAGLWHNRLAYMPSGEDVE
jgi:hypothetical protein